ncbi:MAG: hypothetical protein AAFR52_02035 [Pseudomonadota bacterium]
MDLIADGLLITTALSAALYCAVLSRRLRRLANTDDGLGGQIAALTGAVEEARNALAGLQEQASGLRGQSNAASERVRRELAEARRMHEELSEASGAARRLLDSLYAANGSMGPAGGDDPAGTALTGPDAIEFEAGDPGGEPPPSADPDPGGGAPARDAADAGVGAPAATGVPEAAVVGPQSGRGESGDADTAPSVSVDPEAISVLSTLVPNEAPAGAVDGAATSTVAGRPAEASGRPSSVDAVQTVEASGPPDAPAGAEAAPDGDPRDPVSALARDVAARAAGSGPGETVETGATYVESAAPPAGTGAQVGAAINDAAADSVAPELGVAPVRLAGAPRRLRVERMSL